jgi:hypothetical protein
MGLCVAPLKGRLHVGKAGGTRVERSSLLERLTWRARLDAALFAAVLERAYRPDQRWRPWRERRAQRYLDREVLRGARIEVRCFTGVMQEHCEDLHGLGAALVRVMLSWYAYALRNWITLDVTELSSFAELRALSELKDLDVYRVAALGRSLLIYQGEHPPPGVEPGPVVTPGELEELVQERRKPPLAALPPDEPESSAPAMGPWFARSQVAAVHVLGDDWEAQLHTDIVSIGEVGYDYILVVFGAEETPVLFVCAESIPLAGTRALGVFDARGHHSIEWSPALARVETFEERALALAKDELRLNGDWERVESFEEPLR